MWILILAISISILIASFASLNSAVVSVNLFFWQAPAVSLALVVLFSAMAGVILAALFGTPQYIKKIRELAKKIKELESKVKDLEKEAPPELENILLAKEEKEEKDEEPQEQDPA